MYERDPRRACREMSDIARIVHEAGGDLEARARDAGREIGRALAAYNLDAGHDPVWLAKVAWAAYCDMMQTGFEQVNLVLGLPPDSVS
jgi:hypothetical protein